MNQVEIGKIVKVSVTKESPNERVGLILMMDDSLHDGSIIIKSIAPNSLFAGTQLQPGMLIQTVSGIPVGEMGLVDTMRLLRELEDVVTVEALVFTEDICLSMPAPLPDPEPMMLLDEYEKYSSVPEIMAVPLPMPVDSVLESPTNPSFRPVVSPTREVPPPSTTASSDFPVYPLAPLPDPEPMMLPNEYDKYSSITSRLFAALPDIQDMKLKEMRAELESYGISTRSFLEKREFVDALKKAREEGRTPVNGNNASASSNNNNGETVNGNANGAAEPQTTTTSNPSFRPVVSPTSRDMPPPPSTPASSDFPVFPLATDASIFRVEDSFSFTVNPEPPLSSTSAEPQTYPLATEMSILRPEDSFSDHNDHNDHNDENHWCNKTPLKQNHAVSVTVLKSTMDSLVGVNLVHKRNVGVVVSGIKPESICQGTQLQLGMKILAINDVDCSHCETSSHVVAALLRSCIGSINIQAIFPPDLIASSPQSTGNDQANRIDVVTVTVYKSTKDSKVGLGICDRTYFNTGRRTIPVISSIASDGLAANTALRKDMRVLTLNGVSCRGRDDIIAMIRMALGSLTIVAGSTDMVAATVTKSNNGTSQLGLDLEQSVDGKVRIRYVPRWGLFARTDLRKGMQILQVNGVEVDQLLPEDVQSIIDQVEGTVTVIART